jgi:hypothetical protein
MSAEFVRRRPSYRVVAFLGDGSTGVTHGNGVAVLESGGAAWGDRI